MTQNNPEFQTASLAAWAKAAAKSAPGGNVEALNWHTPDGITVKPLYTAADTQNLPYANTLPGFEPYLRGPQATMYAVRPWTIRQYSGFGSAEESNQRYRFLLAQGQTGLSVALDLPTQCGYDPDDAMARPEIGKVGVSLFSLSEMETLFEGIDLGAISTSFTINGTAAII